MGSRYADLILGIWLFISSWVWAHTGAQFTNTLICGAAATVIALVAMRVEQARYLNTVLAIWLLVSVWVLPTHSRTTGWNNALVAIAIFFFSLGPARMPRPPSIGERRTTIPI